MMLNIVIDYTAERGTIRVHPADKDLMDRTALVIDNNQPTIVDDAAKIIDRLLPHAGSRFQRRRGCTYMAGTT